MVKPVLFWTAVISYIEKDRLAGADCCEALGDQVYYAIINPAAYVQAAEVVKVIVDILVELIPWAVEETIGAGTIADCKNCNSCCIGGWAALVLATMLGITAYFVSKSPANQLTEYFLAAALLALITWAVMTMHECNSKGTGDMICNCYSVPWCDSTIN